MAVAKKLVWDDSFKSGVLAIDAQHKYLFEVINDLADAITSGQGASTIRRALDLVKYYAEWHFGREELCMERFRCPVAGANKAAHGQFLATFQAFDSEYRQSGGSEEIALRMYQELTDWLVHHIRGIDGQLAGCVHAAS